MKEILRTDYKKYKFPFLEHPNSEQLIFDKLIFHHFCLLNYADFSKISL